MRVRLTQLDGKLPNLALMKLAHWHRERGDEVVFKRDVSFEEFKAANGHPEKAFALHQATKDIVPLFESEDVA